MGSPISNRPRKVLLARALASVRAAEGHAPLWYAFVTALVTIVLAYRIELWLVIFHQESQMTRLQSSAVPPEEFLASIINDLVLVCGLGVGGLVLKILALRWMPRLAAHMVCKCVTAIFATALLLFLALIERTHFQLLQQLDTGLTLDFVKTVPGLIEPHDFFAEISGSDMVFFLIPVAVFILARVFARFWQRPMKYLFLALSIVVLGAQFAGQRDLPHEVAANPVFYLAQDAVDDWVSGLLQQNGYYASVKDLPGNAQMNSIRLVDPAFANRRHLRRAPRTGPAVTDEGKSWNILFIVLESTGSDYVFDTSFNNPPPMPFLQKLSHEGLYLSNHFTTANNTAKAAFSLFTGLYPSTGWNILALEDDVSIPTLNRYLPLDYDLFLIHPTPLDVSFPPHLFANNGIKDLYTMENMPSGIRSAPNGMARNELDGVDFLISRLDHASEPFLGVYWSFIPHYPYADYGPEYRILPGTTKQKAYYNNLRTLDTQLQRVYEHLVATGLADRTILVIVGDHGEAFGQHPGVWAHTFGFNAEMFRAPMLFWQPKLIAPQTIKFPTSHVDVVPTLLDILGFSYKPSRFQGESVLRGVPSRKYIFSMDARSEYISALNPQMLKVVLGFHRNFSGAFNLAKDPGEKFPLDEKGLEPETDTIIKFRNYQTQMLKNYNQAILDHRPFPAGDTNSPASPDEIDDE